MARFLAFFSANFRQTTPLLSPFYNLSTLPSSSALPPIRIPNLQSLPPIGGSPLPTGDSDADDFQPTDSVTDQQQQLLLRRFLRLVRQSKDLSSLDDAVSSLRASGFRVEEEGLVCAGMWELRGEWKAAFLGFRWAVDCGVGSGRSWDMMVWVLVRHKFGMAWKLVREMHRLGMDTRSALLILIRRYAAVDEEKSVKTFHAMDKFKVTTDSLAFYIHTLVFPLQA